jgi:signal transduction histidine kinase
VRPAELVRQVRLLTDEIRSQQILGEAERGELQRNVQCVPAQLLIEEVLQGIGPWSARRGVDLAAALPAEPVYLATDALVARRVLLNAVKNAVEAAAPGQTVRVGVAGDDHQVALTVWNPQHMPESTQHQVFQRSFSTKGDGRGLGTYSMRLLMENYLGGSVSFTSQAEAGTTFTLTFPSIGSYLGQRG